MIKLDVKDIHKSYGSNEVLKGVSLQAKAGDVIAMIGSSGSGKSTFLRCINFLESPDSGSISLNGQTIEVLKDKAGRGRVSDPKQLQRFRTKLAMVFQHFNLWAHMTALENIIEAPIHVLGLSKAEATERARHYLQKVGLPETVETQYPSQMSGGQQQRVAIARAVVSNPKIILADEPTGNLDSKNGAEVMQLLTELNKEGTTIVMVTHSKHDAGFAHRVINLFDGSVVSSVSEFI